MLLPEMISYHLLMQQKYIGVVQGELYWDATFQYILLEGNNDNEIQCTLSKNAVCQF